MKLINLFISYRRNDSAGYARSLYNELKKEFNTFFDIEGIDYGEEFPKRIKKGIEKADVVLVILGDDANSEFKNRLERDEKDYVALEIEYAKKLKKDIIPVTINDVRNMPISTNLPENIKFLSDLNAYTVRHDKFSDDILGLKKRIREKHFQIYTWYIVLSLLIILGAIFSFEQPRDYIQSLYTAYHKIKPHKKNFSLTDNLSTYHLMPNPTYNEWKIFLKEKENNQTRENYKEFIEIKNNIDSFNLLEDFIIYNYKAGTLGSANNPLLFCSQNFRVSKQPTTFLFQNLFGNRYENNNYKNQAFCIIDLLGFSRPY